MLYCSHVQCANHTATCRLNACGVSTSISGIVLLLTLGITMTKCSSLCEKCDTSEIRSKGHSASSTAGRYNDIQRCFPALRIKQARECFDIGKARMGVARSANRTINGYSASSQPGSISPSRWLEVDRTFSTGMLQVLYTAAHGVWRTLPSTEKSIMSSYGLETCQRCRTNGRDG